MSRTRAADEARTRLAINSNALRAQLATAGLPLPEGSFGPIVSIVLESERRVLAAAARLRLRGILAQAIRPPTVPVGAARLRLTVKATFEAAEIERLAQETAAACRV